MLLNLRYIKPAYKLNIKGILHIGAHTAEERDLYRDLSISNVSWFEGNPEIFDNLCKIIDNYEGNKAFNYLLTNEPREYDFYIMNHDQSSSIFPLGLHKKFYPNIKLKKKIRLQGYRLDDVIAKEKINLKNYNMLCLDVQGAELNVLQGVTDRLEKFEYIYTEINTIQLYKFGALMDELDIFLKLYGFDREIWSSTTKGWGDALYINKKAKHSLHSKE